MDGPRGSRVTLLVVAGVVLAVLVTQVALAGGGEGPTASSSVTVKTLKKRIAALNAQLGTLTGRVAALESKPDQVGQVPGSLPPSGSAGGDLTGSYPDPTIAPGAVTASKLGVGETRVTFATSPASIEADGPGGNFLSSTISTGTLPAGAYAVFATVNWTSGTSLATAECVLNGTAGSGSDQHFLGFAGAGAPGPRGTASLMYTTSIPAGTRFRLICSTLEGEEIFLSNRKIVPIRLKSQVQEGVAPVNVDE